VSENRKSPPSDEDKAQEPPKYIVSYSAMMTILLAFFIMLNNLAQEREYGLKGAGLGAFKANFVASGLPGFLVGSRTPNMLDHTGGKWRPATDAKAEGKTHEKQGRLISSDAKDLETLFQQAVSARRDVALPLAVSYGEELSAAAKRQLAALARNVLATRSRIMIRASLTPDEGGENPWGRASRWALRVANYLCEEEGVPPARVMAVARIVPRATEDESDDALSDRSSLGVVIVPAGAKGHGSEDERPSVLKNRPVLIQRAVENSEE